VTDGPRIPDGWHLHTDGLPYPDDCELDSYGEPYESASYHALQAALTPELGAYDAGMVAWNVLARLRGLSFDVTWEGRSDLVRRIERFEAQLGAVRTSWQAAIDARIAELEATGIGRGMARAYAQEEAPCLGGGPHTYTMRNPRWRYCSVCWLPEPAGLVAPDLGGEPAWLRDARSRDAAYPETIPDHWTAIADRRRLLQHINNLVLNRQISDAANTTTFDPAHRADERTASGGESDGT
jgi:hypothetical protein